MNANEFLHSLDAAAVASAAVAVSVPPETLDGSAKPRRRHYGNVKGTKLHPQPITSAEAAQLLDGCNPKCDTGKRNRALLVLLWRGMLRSNEAVHVQLTDVNLATGEIRVLMGKGRKARTVALDDKSLAIVAAWVERRQAIAGHGPLFCTIKRRKRGLDNSYVRHLVSHLAKKVGLGKRVHPHGLRHSGACEMLRAGVHIGIISKALGHKSIATTARYLDHISPADVIGAMRKLEW